MMPLRRRERDGDPKGGANFLTMRDRLFALMHRNAASPMRFFGLAPSRVIEVGTQVEM